MFFGENMVFGENTVFGENMVFDENMVFGENMVLENIHCQFFHSLKIMARNSFSGPQPDSLLRPTQEVYL